MVEHACDPSILEVKPGSETQGHLYLYIMSLRPAGAIETLSQNKTKQKGTFLEA